MAIGGYAVSQREIEGAVALCGLNPDGVLRSMDGQGRCASGPGISEGEVKGLLHEMGEAAFSTDPDEFAMFASRNKERIREAARESEDVARMLIVGYKVGIAQGSGECMNDLGALYYMGELVEQDYGKAAELYGMAMEHGCIQSIVNLGYIWEYGRTGRRDYAKAFESYAMAASLGCSSEAAYKLGDMYARGRFVERNMAKAHQLWCKSLDLAQGIVEVAQPALRIAQLLISRECEEARAVVRRVAVPASVPTG